MCKSQLHVLCSFHITSSYIIPVVLCLMSMLWSVNVKGQPIPSDDSISVFEIEARVRNGKTVYEGALFTPNTPPPYAPGGGLWQMNPAGSPVWNSNGNTYGDIHSFLFTYTMATGTTVWKIDFNRDGDYNDPQETVLNTAPTLIGKGFRYLNIWGQGHDIGLIASLTDFTINGVNFGSYASSTNTPFNAFFEDESGIFSDITASGNFSFSGDGGRECPRIWLRLGSVNEDPTCLIVSPADGLILYDPDTIVITAVATDETDSIAVVDFFVDDTPIGSDSLAPYNNISLLNMPVGMYVLTARSMDNLGATTTSLPVHITVRCVREDLDNDGTVNSNDFLIFLPSFDNDCVGCIQDFNDDGKIDSFDFLRLLAVLGYTCN